MSAGCQNDRLRPDVEPRVSGHVPEKDRGGRLWKASGDLADPYVKILVNGKEIFRWDSPRVCSVPMHLILQNEIGGWDNDPVDDAQLPADFVVDYIRVWQRKDLASPQDGPKPNNGELRVK